MEDIIKYIQEKYNPLSVILYGSYANGTNNLNSDFDALVISSDNEQFHDTSFVDGIQLDVFVYPSTYFEKDYSCEDFVQIFDGHIIADNNGIEALIGVPSDAEDFGSDSNDSVINESESIC